MIEELMKFLDNNKEKNIVINQLGFIESQFYINKMGYVLKNDILTISDSKQKISINTNQIYKLDYINQGIIIYLDNDTEIKISV